MLKWAVRNLFRNLISFFFLVENILCRTCLANIISVFTNNCNLMFNERLQKSKKRNSLVKNSYLKVKIIVIRQP